MSMANNFIPQRKKRKRVELTIAPLIDMVFLLLIFFVVTTTFSKETGITVERPSAASSDLLPKENVLIALDKEGRIFIDDKELTLIELRDYVKAQLKRNPKTVFTLLADKKSQTEAVIDALDECRLAGARRLSLATKVEVPGKN
ncbi:MAG: biopolymer transporter ExbD [bacterium]|nr:biopolymer transporter ExbD [bacterium]